MSEPTKALLVVLGIIFIPIIIYFAFLFLRDHYKYKNAIEVDFKKVNGKIVGYVKDKRGNWIVSEDTYLEEDEELLDNENNS